MVAHCFDDGQWTMDDSWLLVAGQKLVISTMDDRSWHYSNVSTSISTFLGKASTVAASFREAGAGNYEVLR
jgi:hypothetical protein